jgi:hypothetical protein
MNKEMNHMNFEAEWMVAIVGVDLCFFEHRIVGVHRACLVARLDSEVEVGDPME